MDIDAYMGRVYPSPPCWALVADVYARERGHQVAEHHAPQAVRSIASAFRLALHQGGHGFGRVATPVDYAVVLMGRTARLGLHHCGIAYGGRVLHASDDGTWYQDLATLRAQYALMEFWARPC